MEALVTNDPQIFDTELQTLWQNQSPNHSEVTMEAVMNSSRKFRHTIERRNSIEWAAALAVAPLFVYRAIHSDSVWSQLMNLELAIAGLFIALHIFYRGRNDRTPDTSVSTAEYIGYSKSQLEKQIELLSTVRYWYVAPVMFGLLGLHLEQVWLNWSTAAVPWAPIARCIFTIAIGVAVIWLNEVWAIGSLRRKIVELPKV